MYCERVAAGRRRDCAETSSGYQAAISGPKKCSMEGREGLKFPSLPIVLPTISPADIR